MTFKVSIVDTPFDFPCEPDESVLNAAQRAGFEIPFSCRKGVCGTCKGRVLSGDVRAFMGDALTASERATGHALFCNTRPRSDLLVSPRAISRIDPFARKTVDARVFRLERLADDVMLVHLRFPAGIRVKFKAGQHLNLILENGDRRDFSMANSPSESDGAQLHIRLVPGGAFTGHVFSRLRQGDILRAEIPFGDFTLQPGAKPIVFVAGSTGFAPIHSIIEDMLAKGLRRPWKFYWGARHRGGLYLDTPLRWMRQAIGCGYVPVLSESLDDGFRHGLVHRAVLEDYPSLAGVQVYACGVPAMVQAARTEFMAAGLLEQDFFSDTFVTQADMGTDPADIASPCR